jgi:hypothetical protein
MTVEVAGSDTQFMLFVAWRPTTVAVPVSELSAYGE